MTRTWAEVTKPKKPPERKKTPQLIRTEKINTSEETKNRIADLERRTFIVRRVDPEATVETIIAELHQQAPTILQVTDPLAPIDFLEQVRRDELDRRRFYITFASHDIKRSFQETGFSLGKTTIPPKKSDFQGFIQFPPYFLSRVDLKLIASQYGTIVEDTFVSHQGVRTGGWHFELLLHQGAKVPNIIHLDGEAIEITDKSARKRCSWCHNYGHLERHCQKRKKARMEQLEARVERVEAMDQDSQAISSSAPARIDQQHHDDPTIMNILKNNTTLSKEDHLAEGESQVKATFGDEMYEKRTAPIFYAGEKHPRHCRDLTSSGDSEPPLKLIPQQELPSEASSQPLHPHPPPSPKSAASKINALFKEFADDHPIQPYEHYVAKRKEFAMQSRREIAAEQYPSRDLNRLSQEEWEAMKEPINARFRELLISEFPDNHFQMNALYLNEKQNQAKPP